MASDDLSRNEIDAKLRELDNELDKLRRNYEQFFVGARERPPRNDRKRVERLVRELEQAQVTNTSQKFRLRSLVQRFSSYRQKWNRIQRQIEEGTYQPHQKRAERRTDTDETNPSDSPQSDGEREESDDDHVVELEEDLGDVDLEGLERELEQMDETGELEAYVHGSSGGDSAESRPRREGEDSADIESRNPAKEEPGDTDEATKKEKIRRMQEKLGISSGSGPSEGDRGDSSEHPEGEPRPDPSASRDAPDSSRPTGGADRESLESMPRNLRDRPNGPARETDSAHSDRRDDDRPRSSRSERRPEGRSESRRTDRDSSDDESSASDDDEEVRAERLFRRLVAAKRERGQPTEHLSLDAIRRSMRRKRRSLAEEYEAGAISFEVVVKDGGVFLQPQLPD